MTARRAFTLVEMTIVIGIIILLAGLTLAVSVSVVQGSEIRQTKLTIQLLDSAVREWELQADRQVTYGADDTASGMFYEIQEDDINTAQVTGELLTIVSRSASIKKILATVDPESLVQMQDIYDPQIRHLQFRDAWDKPIVAIFPGRKWVTADAVNPPRDLDGTIRTDTELWCGIAGNRRICFVSAGPDGAFGNIDQASAEYDPEAARDNLYSYLPQIDQ